MGSSRREPYRCSQVHAWPIPFHARSACVQADPSSGPHRRLWSSCSSCSSWFPMRPRVPFAAAIAPNWKTAARHA